MDGTVTTVPGGGGQTTWRAGGGGAHRVRLSTMMHPLAMRSKNSPMPRRPKGPVPNRCIQVRFVSKVLSMCCWFNGHYKGCGWPRWFRGEVRNPPLGLHPQEFMLMPQRPIEPGENGKPRNPKAHIGGWSKTYAELAGWLCDETYADGSPIGVVQLVLYRSNGAIVCDLRIADGQLRLRGIERSPDMALNALEALLRATPVPWEPCPFPIGGGKDRRKGK